MFSTLYRIVDRGDPCALVLLIGILTFVGSKTVQNRWQLRRLGILIAVTVFVAFCGEYMWRAMPTDAWGLLRIAVRGLLSAGLTLGASWILLPLATIGYAGTVGELMRKAHEAAAEAKRRAEEKARRDEEAKRRAEEDERRRVEKEERQ